MSDVLYPIGVIREFQVLPRNRVIKDEFEDGSESVNTLWTDQYFKRQLKVGHAPLSQTEFTKLLEFWNARNGQYDSFWFHDNITRKGNFKVRFEADAMDYRYSGSQVADVVAGMREVAPIRAMPELADIETALGATTYALLRYWFDANRQTYIRHNGVETAETSFFDAGPSGLSVPLASSQEWTPFSVLTQYWDYWLKGRYGVSTANLTATGTNYWSLFAIVKYSSATGPYVLFCNGAMGAGNAAGLQITASNEFAPWLGGSEAWTNAKSTNSPVDTYRSIAVVLSGTNCSLYVNGTLIGTDTQTRNTVTGPVAVGAAIDGTLGATKLTYNNANHLLGFNAALTITEIRALHNLLRYQYGLAAV